MRITSCVTFIVLGACSTGYVDTGSKFPDIEVSTEPSEPASEEPASEEPSEPASEVPIDADGDGFFDGEDCDDTNPNVNPNQEENSYDGFDNDCDAESKDDDLDGDGVGIEDDCDDTNEDIFPDAIDNLCDGIDNIVTSRLMKIGRVTIMNPMIQKVIGSVTWVVKRPLFSLLFFQIQTMIDLSFMPPMAFYPALVWVFM